MIKQLLLLISSATILIANSVPALVVDPDPAGLNVRSKPGGSVIGTLPSGDYAIVLTIDTVIGNWAHFIKTEAFSYRNGVPIKLSMKIPQKGFVFKRLVNVLEYVQDVGSNHAYRFFIINEMKSTGIRLMYVKKEYRDEQIVTIGDTILDNLSSYSDLVYPFPREYSLRSDESGRNSVELHDTITIYESPKISATSFRQAAPLRTWYGVAISNNGFFKIRYYINNSYSKEYERIGYVKSDALKDFQQEGGTETLWVSKIPGLPCHEITASIEPQNKDYFRIVDAWRHWLKIEIHGRYYWVDSNYWSC